MTSGESTMNAAQQRQLIALFQLQISLSDFIGFRQKCANGDACKVGGVDGLL